MRRVTWKLTASLAPALLVVGASTTQALQQSPPLPEVPRSSIGYPTVAAAMDALRSRPGVVFTTENGWTIATDEAAYTIWSFAPRDYPAYPAVVRRRVVREGAQIGMRMDILCEA